MFHDEFQKLSEENFELFKESFVKEFPPKVSLLDPLYTIALDRDLNEHFYCGKNCDWLLCHGNLWNNNIFINEKECVFIDWQCASAGCPLGDIATLLTFGTDIGPQPSKRFATLVQMYLDFLLECCGCNAALREMVERRIVPVLSDPKKQRMALQFGVKWIIGSWDITITKAPREIVNRLLYNAMHILLEMSH